MTIDQLYEAFMDKEQDFASDIYQFLSSGSDLIKKGHTLEEWTKQWAPYLPEFDEGSIKLAERERDIAYDKARKTLELTEEATEQVYQTEADTLSSALGSELSKVRGMAGKGGLRSGAIDSAIADTISISGDKVGDLGDRLRIAQDEMKDIYNIAMVDAALDFDKSERQEKEDFYDRTMRALLKIEGLGGMAHTGEPVGGICWENADIDWYNNCSDNCEGLGSRRKVNECKRKCVTSSGAAYADWSSGSGVCP